MLPTGFGGGSPNTGAQTSHLQGSGVEATRAVVPPRHPLARLVCAGSPEQAAGRHSPAPAGLLCTQVPSASSKPSGHTQTKLPGVL